MSGASTSWLNGIAQTLATDGDVQPEKTRTWNFLGATSEYNPATDAHDITIAGVGGTGTGLPAPYLVSTSNIALTGIVTVDGVASSAAVTAVKDILCTAQTSSSQNGYWTPNNSGVWTRSSYYNADADVAAALGQLSGAALGGTLNKGKQFYALSGSTLAGAKVWYPAASDIEINISDAPWYWKGDGSNQDAVKVALQAYMTTASLAGLGGTLKLNGAYGYASKFVVPPNWNILGMSVGTSLAPIVNGDPYDSVSLPARLNIGAAGYNKISGLKIKNPWGEGAVSAWAASTAYTVGQFRYPTRCSNVILKCTVGGTSGAFEPIGELSNTAFIKAVGTPAAAAQTLLIPTVGGYLGTFAFKVSANAGVTQSAVQTTTAGDYQTYNVDAVIGGSTYGATFGFTISNQPYRTAVHTVGAGGFVQPAVYTTSAPAFVNALVDSSSGFLAGDYVLGSTGGLWMVRDTPDATHVNLWNVGANGAAAPGVTIPATTTLTLCHAPAPRIEVLGTPPAAGYLVDLQAVGGPLGSASCQYQEGHGNTVERWKFGGTFGSGTFQNTTSGATYTSPALSGTSLTLKFHSGLYFNNGTWSYLTPSQGWSEQVGSTVVDGGVTWQICAGVSCLDMAAGFTTLEDIFYEGGTFGLTLNQCEAVTLQGNCTYSLQRSVSLWAKQGSITNAIAINGSHGFFGAFVSIVIDGCLGFSTAGMLALQGGSQASMYLAGCDGVNLSGLYLEAYGNLCRNSTFFGRNGTGISVADLEIGGGYMGSVAGAFTFDFYQCSAVSIHGLAVAGATAAFVGVNTCSNFNVEGCRHVAGGATFDFPPISGHGFVGDNGGTFYQYGSRILSSTPNRTFSGTTDTALAADNCGNVTSTGAAAVTVTVGVQAAGTIITYEQGGAGALSFSASGVTLQTALAAAGATSGQYQARTLFWKTTTTVRIT